MAKKNILTIIAGMLLLFGLSGLIYGFVPYPFAIGSISLVISLILIIITDIKKRLSKKETLKKKRKRK